MIEKRQVANQVQKRKSNMHERMKRILKIFLMDNKEIDMSKRLLNHAYGCKSPSGRGGEGGWEQ